MGEPEKKEDYRNRWQRENQERIIAMVPKGRKGEIKAAADSLGLSLNAYIVGAIDRRMAEGGPKGEREGL